MLCLGMLPMHTGEVTAGKDRGTLTVSLGADIVWRAQALRDPEAGWTSC